MKFIYAFAFLIATAACFGSTLRTGGTNCANPTINKVYQSDSGFAVSLNNCAVPKQLTIPSWDLNLFYMKTDFSSDAHKALFASILTAKSDSSIIEIVYDSTSQENLKDLFIIQHSDFSNTWGFKILGFIIQ